MRQKRIGKCGRCGNDFRARHSLSRFCSKACASAVRGEAKRARWDLDEHERLFWAKVQRGSPTDCWEWAGATVWGGYGALNRQGVVRRAHRVAWELVNGPIPDAMHVCHRCDNPPCCNPAHLFLGTRIDNMADKDVKERGRNQRGPWRGKHWRQAHEARP